MSDFSDSAKSTLIPRILEIADDSDPILKLVSGPVPSEDIETHEIQQLLADMKQTMYSANGIGLAAPQVRVSKRIMVFYLPAARDDSGGDGVPFTVLINPEIEVLDDDIVVDFEGCLSVPNKRGKVPRARMIRYSGLDESGCKLERIAEGWHARLFQHEFDHLNGILYPELMAEEDRLMSVDEWKLLTGK